jgi:hypothetical protein
VTREEIERALYRLGWRVTEGPTRTPGGYKATIARITASKLATGSTEIGVLEDLLRSVEERAGRKP